MNCVLPSASAWVDYGDKGGARGAENAPCRLGPSLFYSPKPRGPLVVPRRNPLSYLRDCSPRSTGSSPNLHIMREAVETPISQSNSFPEYEHRLNTLEAVRYPTVSVLVDGIEAELMPSDAVPIGVIHPGPSGFFGYLQRWGCGNEKSSRAPCSRERKEGPPACRNGHLQNLIQGCHGPMLRILLQVNVRRIHYVRIPTVSLIAICARVSNRAPHYRHAPAPDLTHVWVIP